MPITTWAGVSGGESFSIATKTDGTLWTWGASAKGQSGLNALTYLSSPVQVGALTTWLQVSTSYRHTAAVTTDGKLFSWGDNASYGMLGQNDVTLRSSPVQVGAATVWSRVVAGRSQTIGFRAP